MTDVFTLQLPPDAAYVGTARMFASTLARHYEIPDELVEDVKLAISEACARALAVNGAEQLTLRAHREGDRLAFEIEQGELGAQPNGTDTPTPSSVELAKGLSLELVSALFEDAKVRIEPSGPVLRFTVG